MEKKLKSVMGNTNEMLSKVAAVPIAPQIDYEA